MSAAIVHGIAARFVAAGIHRLALVRTISAANPAQVAANGHGNRDYIRNLTDRSMSLFPAFPVLGRAVQVHYGNNENSLGFRRIEYSIRKASNQCSPYLSLENRPGLGLRGYPVD